MKDLVLRFRFLINRATCRISKVEFPAVCWSISSLRSRRLFWVHTFITLCKLCSQKRYDGAHVVQNPSPSIHQPSNCGTAPARRTTRPRDDLPPSRTTLAPPMRTPCKPSPSCPTAITTCRRKCTRCRCPRLHPTGAALHPEKPPVQAALGARRQALLALSNSCPAPSWTLCSSVQAGVAGLLAWTSGTTAGDPCLRWRWRTAVRGKSTDTIIS